MDKDGGLHEREADFHDRWASETSVERVMVRECFEALSAQENRFIVRLVAEKMGGFKGKRVLDLGPGLGESAIYFALQGAYVTATDISPEMVKLCIEAAAYHGVEDRVRGLVIPADGFDLEEKGFDIIFAANLFHHIQDIGPMLVNIKRHLRPGGMLISWDPVAYNPVINVYRRMAEKVRTEDEHPLKVRDMNTIRGVFPDMRHKEFWFTTLVIFLKYYFIDRKDPNEYRYWKEILKETDATIGWWFRPLLALDCALRNIPGVRWLAWNTVVWGTRTD